MNTKTKTNTEPPQTMGVHKTIDQQQQHNHRLRTDSSLSYREGCFYAFYWRKLFALGSVVIKTQFV